MEHRVPTPDEENKYFVDQADKPGSIRDITSDSKPSHWVEIDPVAEKKLRMKLDICLLPICILINLFSFIDRANIGNARVAGLDVDTGLVGYDFQVGQTIFYIMYLAVEVPSNLIFKKVGSLWLSFLVIGFGVISIGTGFINNKAGVFATRFLLGTFEGGLLPGIAYLCSRYYTRQELVFRIGCFLALSPSLSGAFGGLLAYGLLQVNPVGAVVSWRRIFVWEGVITTSIGIISLFLLPTWPEKTRMLNAEERALAIARIQNENPRTAEEDKHENWRVSVKGAFNIPTVCCIIGFAAANSTVQGLAVFLPTIIRSLGSFTALEIQLKTIPPNVLGAGYALILTYIGWRIQKRGLLIAISMPITIVGWLLFLLSKDPNARYAACFLAFTGIVPLGPVWMSWGMNNVSGATSRGVVAGLVPGLGTVGSIIGNWCFTSDQAPAFRPGNIVNITLTTGSWLLGIFLWYYVRRENKLRASGAKDYLIEGKSEAEIKALQHHAPTFRYVE